MVWSAIAYNTWSPLILIRGTMTAQWYVRDILQPHVLPLIQRLPGGIFNKTMLGLTRPGCHKIVSVLLLPFLWPARSTDLSPIERIWDHLGWRVGHPTSLKGLEARLQQIWNEMSKLHQNLYASLPDCIASCICSRVVSTGY
ncbi:transposable element Tcb1 transposase [Trichonephila clavipes]|uniref:Transposable element Tcb1 transposase n=1 Tax=Trichonephila clavipes TaxID=2585209 RepID=A0A8X6WKU6_TRICX|nr:transposable element Tcb1 transposase [Trichonephila clavipes]